MTYSLNHAQSGTANYPNQVSSSNSGTISTGGPDELVVFLFATGRSQDVGTGFVHISVDSIAASGLTFTRIFHDVSFEFNNAANGNGSFPNACFGFDIFVAPAASQVTNLAWSIVNSGDHIINNQACYHFSIAGLPDISDASILAAITAMNVTTSVINPKFLIDTSVAETFLVNLFVYSNNGFSPNTTAGFTSLGTLNPGGDSTSGFKSLCQYQDQHVARHNMTIGDISGTTRQWYGVTIGFGDPDASLSPSIGNFKQGQLIDSSSSIGSGTAGTITAGADELVCILFATARIDTTQHESRVTAVSATGLAFTEAFDELLFADVGGTFPKSAYHLQLYCAPAASAQASLAWSSTMSDALTNTQSAVIFTIRNVDISAPFDGLVSIGSAVTFEAHDVSGSTGTPTVSMTTTGIKDLLLTAFIDIREDSEGTTPLTPAPGSGFEPLARVTSGRSFTAGNLYLQGKEVLGPVTSQAQAGGWTTKNWIAVAFAFSSDSGESSGEMLTDEIKTNTLTIEVGTSAVTVPEWVGFLKIELFGAGGGSPGYAIDFLDLPSHIVGTITPGGNATDSSISTLSMTADGGDGGGQVLIFTNHPFDPAGIAPQLSYGGTLGAAGGAASGGDTNVAGEGGTSPVMSAVPGSYVYTWVTGEGLTPYQNYQGSPGKGGGMALRTYVASANIPTAQRIQAVDGIKPGRGADGAIGFGVTGGFATCGGGQGGYSMKQWAEADSDAPPPGTVWNYSLGTAGAAGLPTSGNALRINGAAGAPPRLRMTWGSFYTVGSAAESDAASFHSDLDSDSPSSQDDPAVIDLFPGVPRTPASPFADFDSLWSIGPRMDAGLITGVDFVGTSSSTFPTSAFNGNYGFAAGDGPTAAWATTFDPNHVYMWFTVNKGIKLRGLTFRAGDSGDFRNWSLWAGFDHDTMIPLSDSFAWQNVSNGLETEMFVFNIVPDDYDLDFTYFELRMDGGTSKSGRLMGEIELSVAHSPFDGGNRNEDGEKRIYVSSDIALDVPNSHYDGTWKGLIAGRHYHANRIGTLTTTAGVTTSGSFGAGKHITFEFPREVAMRECALECSTAEVYDSDGDPTIFGKWQWAASNNGTDWTDVGGVLQFAEGSTLNMLPSPQDDSPSSDEELISFRFWRMTSVQGFSASRSIWGITFNLMDPIFGHSPSADASDSGESDESNFESSGDVTSDADSSSGSPSDSSGGGSGGGSDSSGAPSSSEAPSSSDVTSFDPGSFVSDSFGDHDPDTLPIVQVSVIGLY